MEILRPRAEGTVAVDFFTVETVGLTGLHVRFFLEVERAKCIWQESPRTDRIAGPPAPAPPEKSSLQVNRCIGIR